jgi:transposase-like protein
MGQFFSIIGLLTEIEKETCPMAILTLQLRNVKASNQSRPSECLYCGSGLLQRWGAVTKTVKDTHVRQAIVYRYRCCQCWQTFRHYPDGVTSARQSQRLVQLAALGWVLGLSLRGTSAILSAFPVALSHTSIWRDVQVLAAELKRRLPRQVRVLGVDGVYPKLGGREQPTLVCVDLGSGQPVALGAIPEKDWRAVVKWLEPLVKELGVEVLVSDDLRELAVVADRLQLPHQVCHFHVLRWVRRALRDLRKQLDDEHHQVVDQVWRIMKERPPDGRTRLFALWKGINVRRARDKKTTALYRLRLLILRLHDNWEKYTLDQRDPGVPATNNATERAIGRWRIRSRSTRGFKSWAGFEAGFLLCGSELV